MLRSSLSCVKQWVLGCSLQRKRRIRPRPAGGIAAVESLEARQLLAATMSPAWDNVSALTVSFAPDGTTVDGRTNTLSAMMGSVGTEAQWKQTILSAFQAWSVNSNINVGLVADGGQAFGVGGPTQGDARFGDIRIAAVPLSSDVLAISIPRSGALSGTWVGDVLFNSNARIGSLGDLYAITLHEAGHVFGLEHSTDPASPMYKHNDPGVSKTLTATDILNLQKLYGVRTADLNETSRANDSLKNATRIKGNEVLNGFTGATPLLAWGDITRAADTDYFELAAYPGYTGSATFELRTAGMSQMRGLLMVFDQKGALVGQAAAPAGANTNLSVTISNFNSAQKYYARVSSVGGGVNAVGSYALVVKYDRLLQTPEATIDAVARGRYDFLPVNDVQRLLSNAGQPLFNDDLHADDSSTTGRALRSTPGFAQFTRYGVVASIADATDVDYHRITTPKTTTGTPLVMAATVRGLQEGGLLPTVTLEDSSGLVVPAQIVANGLGVYTIQAAGLAQGKSYYLRVSAATTEGAYATGNYSLQVRFTPYQIEQTDFVSGTLDAQTSQQMFQLDVEQSQLFQFALAAGVSSTTEPVAVQMAVFNAAGHLVYRLVGPPGELRTASSTLLAPGTYFVQVSAATRSGTPISSLAYRLLGSVLSDPIGPIPGDPTGAPPPGGSTGSPLGPRFTWQTGTTAPVPATVSTSTTNPWSPLAPDTRLVYKWYWSFGLAGAL